MKIVPLNDKIFNNSPWRDHVKILMCRQTEYNIVEYLMTYCTVCLVTTCLKFLNENYHGSGITQSGGRYSFSF